MHLVIDNWTVPVLKVHEYLGRTIFIQNGIPIHIDNCKDVFRRPLPYQSIIGCELSALNNFSVLKKCKKGVLIVQLIIVLPTLRTRKIPSIQTFSHLVPRSQYFKVFTSLLYIIDQFIISDGKREYCGHYIAQDLLKYYNNVAE